MKFRHFSPVKEQTADISVTLSDSMISKWGWGFICFQSDVAYFSLSGKNEAVMEKRIKSVRGFLLSVCAGTTSATSQLCRENSAWSDESCPNIPLSTEQTVDTRLLYLQTCFLPHTYMEVFGFSRFHAHPERSWWENGPSTLKRTPWILP